MKKMLVLLAVLTVVIAGCTHLTSKDASDTSLFDTPDKTIRIQAFSFGYTPDNLTFTEGEKIRLIIENKENGVHTFTLPEFGIDKRLNGKTNVSIDFIPDKSGTFEFFCTITFHRPSGMEGTLEVKI